MKKFSLIIVTVFLLSPVLTYAKGNNSPFYFGLKGGFIGFDEGLSSSAFNVGVSGGYQWGRHMSTEMEYMSSIVDGKNTGGNDVDYTVFSAFAVFRTRTPVKLKVKAGLTDVDGGGLNGIEFSYGLGVGFWSAGGLMEVEYTFIDDGLDFLSLGVNYYF